MQLVPFLEIYSDKRVDVDRNLMWWYPHGILDGLQV
jgi:hypothetical protein